MITSADNQQIKNIRLLLEKPSARRKQGLYVVEGVRMFLEAPPALIEKVFASESFMAKSVHALRIGRLPHEIVSDSVFKKISDTFTPQGVLLLMKMPGHGTEKLSYAEKDGICLILNRIQDPGNLGTMIRTAEAAGANCVIMDGECADIFNPKTIRSTMGSVFRVPLVVAEDLPAVIADLQTSGMKIIAADLGGEEFYEMPGGFPSMGIMIGNEGSGLAGELLDRADIRLRIPMSGKVNSLNAAISAALLMYQARNVQR